MDSADDYTRRLRDVFDLCDVDKRGYISIDHFVQLANEHFGTSGWDADNQEVCLFYSVALIWLHFLAVIRRRKMTQL